MFKVLIKMKKGRVISDGIKLNLVVMHLNKCFIDEDNIMSFKTKVKPSSDGKNEAQGQVDVKVKVSKKPYIDTVLLDLDNDVDLVMIDGERIFPTVEKEEEYDQF